jgi:hypothetical protein
MIDNIILPIIFYIKAINEYLTLSELIIKLNKKNF